MTARPARGPRPAGSETRSHIVAAAGEVFSASGYERGSMRAVARVAGVDPALVRHYFSSKVELFVESMRPPFDIDTQAHRIADGDPDKVGERVMAFFLSAIDDPVSGPRMITILRTAFDHPEVAARMQEYMLVRVAEHVARLVGSPDPPASAASAASQILGLAMLRNAARIEPLASMEREELMSRFAPIVTQHLRG